MFETSRNTSDVKKILSLLKKALKFIKLNVKWQTDYYEHFIHTAYVRKSCQDMPYNLLAIESLHNQQNVPEFIVENEKVSPVTLRARIKCETPLFTLLLERELKTAQDQIETVEQMKEEFDSFLTVDIIRSEYSRLISEVKILIFSCIDRKTTANDYVLVAPIENPKLLEQKQKHCHASGCETF